MTLPIALPSARVTLTVQPMPSAVAETVPFTKTVGAIMSGVTAGGGVEGFALLQLLFLNDIVAPQHFDHDRIALGKGGIVGQQAEQLAHQHIGNAACRQVG